MPARQSAALRMDQDIDGIVESLLADPGSADEAKRLLRKKMQLTAVVNMMAPAMPMVGGSDDDLDDLWDNVPI